LAERLGLENLPLLSERIDTERRLILPSPATAGYIAESRNSQLASLGFSVARRQAELRAASLSWIPSLRLTGSFGISGRRYPLSRYNWTVGLSVDFSSPLLSGNFGTSAGRDPPFDSNARVQQTLTPAPDPGAVFSRRAAELALIYERSRYETARKDVRAAADRGVKVCMLHDKRRALASEALKLEEEKFHLAELKLYLGEITRIELMEARLDYAKREAALVEMAVAVLQAERDLERLLDLEPGELAVLAEAK
jgi:outer membrane protein TolC